MANDLMLIGLGNAGHNIVKEIANRPSLSDVKLYAIDSVYSKVDLNTINTIKFIGISSDNKNGSGRSRERGAAMYKFHEMNHEFDEMYKAAKESKEPVFVVSSAAGGTGSGSLVPLCEALINEGVSVVPVIICPNKDDPDAFHLNANDLFVELDNVGVKTYSTFENSKGDADYNPINKEVVDMFEIVFGMKYDDTDLDSIDDSDLDVVLSKPGRFIAIQATSNNILSLKQEITRKALSGYQSSWTVEDSKKYTLITAFSLKSMFAEADFKTVFEEINKRLPHVFDEYRHIVKDDNSGTCEATLIIAGLPRPNIKDIDNEYEEAKSIGDGIKTSKRPSFMTRKKAHIENKDNGNGDNISKFSWKN